MSRPSACPVDAPDLMLGQHLGPSAQRPHAGRGRGRAPASTSARGAARCGSAAGRAAPRVRRRAQPVELAAAAAAAASSGHATDAPAAAAVERAASPRARADQTASKVGEHRLARSSAASRPWSPRPPAGPARGRRVRAGRPLTVTRQSKQTPIPQNSPRGRPPNRVVRQERMPAAVQRGADGLAGRDTGTGSAVDADLRRRSVTRRPPRPGSGRGGTGARSRSGRSPVRSWASRCPVAGARPMPAPSCPQAW